MTYTQIGDITALKAESFKVWAKIDEGNDEVVALALREAALRIQEYTNIALIPCTIMQTPTTSSTIRMMLPIGNVLSVIDSKGNDCDFTFNRFTFDFKYSGKIEKVQIEYTTAPEPAQVERMLIPVWELALAIYDGNTDEQNKVIQRLPIELC